ncbi:MAG: ribosomal protein S5 domain 2-type protein [Lentinula lateritia]|uniref:Ribosomal protein S5 domain 2-type protein n=1 Tax=Lentinula lateritia TaxID=40482 RepID=A0ABQ8VVE0_9AGAR|nr:MAG: ribosomal protein S5 domain 2-type protein [Lentinula lateritia]KAJ4500346.1 ribosomal protein S5 domain 2-type protein [Lentinula lateritia]
MLFFARQRLTFIIQRRNLSTEIANSSSWPYPIYASERLHDRKSIFVAHASRLPNDSLFPLFLEVLTASPKLKKATHCMYAYRTSEPQSSTSHSKSKLITGQHDGGESGSGNHLARLLDVTGCENTVVVCSRWYGGVQLGGDRWRRITHVAKEALDKGGFCGMRDEADRVSERPKKKGQKKKK